MEKIQKRKRVKLLHYSIDKIKLEFLWVKTDRVQSFLNSLVASDYTLYYESKKLTSCKHNFKWGEGDGAIYLGVIPNWENENRSDKNVVLEYNPNKVDPFLISELVWLKNIPRICVKVMSFDIAVDMSIPYDTVRMLKRDVREYQCHIGHRKVETQYLGELGHNHVKLYNKAKEQKIKGIDWTRFEITCKKINSFSSTLKEFQELLKIPTLYYVCAQMSLSEFEQLNDTTRIILESIIADINVLNTIKDYKTRKKYERLLSEYLNPIDISFSEIYRVYQEFGNNFMENDNQKSFQLIDITSILISQHGF